LSTSGWLLQKLNQSGTERAHRFSEADKVQPFSSEFIGQYGLGSESNVQRVVDSLLEKDVIDRDNGSFLISDRFFRLLVQRMQLG